MVVYGITGKKEHGKDSFAALVKAYNKDFQILRFADDLKLMASEIFDIPLELMHSTAGKTHIFPEPIFMDNYLTKMQDVTGLAIQGKVITAKSLRELLQFFGTEYVRSVEDLYWINRVTSKIQGRPTLITDTRFLNEEASIRNIGGKIIRINRIDAPETEDSHKSETEMDKIVADVTLGTVTGKYILQEMAAQSLSKTNDGSGNAYSMFELFDYQSMNEYDSYGNSIIGGFLKRYYE